MVVPGLVVVMVVAVVVAMVVVLSMACHPLIHPRPIPVLLVYTASHVVYV
jgi:hypothetical protein